MNDSDFYPIWQQAVTSDAPFEQAIEAGRVAQSPGLIFVAGYQAAIRATFPELRGKDWFTFAVSEDRHPESVRPGVNLSQGQVSGFKTWIAAANNVDKLVLKVGSGADAVYGLVDASSEKVIMNVKDRPGFLPDMSQGEAQFLGADFVPLQQAKNVGRFHEFEPYYIYLALLARIQGSDVSAAVSLASAAIEQQRQRHDLVMLDLAVAKLLDVMAENEMVLGHNWETDQRLFTMYSKRIQSAATD